MDVKRDSGLRDSDLLGALQSGFQVNQYVIQDVLGHGGFGVVYRARHCELETIVALKEYLPTEIAIRQSGTVHPRSRALAGHYEEGLRRFVEEAKRLVRFRNDPSVVTCLEFFRVNGTAYLVMEYEEGLPLSELLSRREAAGRPLSEDEMLDLMEPLLEGLARVHEAGVLHRDIKPSNILVRREDERPVLIDFGAAKQEFAIHSKSAAPYTEGYAAIEQIGAGDLGPWTDLYGIGAVMWRIVAGGSQPWSDPRWNRIDWKPPNPPKVEMRMAATARQQPDPLPSAREVGHGRYSEGVLAAIDRCLELLERDRIQDCLELLRQLRQGTESSQSAWSEDQPSDSRKVAWKHPADVGTEEGGIIATGNAGPGPDLPSIGGYSTFPTTDSESIFTTLGGRTASPIADGSILPTGAAREREPPGRTLRLALAVLGVFVLVLLSLLWLGGSPEEEAILVEGGDLTVETEPSSAQVRFLDIEKDYQPGMALDPGEYRVAVSAPGYETAEETILHGAGPTNARIRLTRASVPRERAELRGREATKESTVGDAPRPNRTPARDRSGPTAPTAPPSPAKSVPRQDVEPRGGLESRQPKTPVPAIPDPAPVHVPADNVESQRVPNSTAPPPPPVPEKKTAPRRIRVGGNVAKARLIRQVRPAYPPLARQARIQGTVKLSAVIGKDGSIKNLDVQSGHPLLVPAALDAVKQWHYKPTLVNGEAVDVLTNIDVNFTLSG